MDHVLSTIHAARTGRAGFLRRLLGAMGLRHSRHRLAELDDHLLRDLGLTRGEARREAGRPSWNAPDHWLR